MPLLVVLVAALSAALLATGRLPVDRLPADLTGMPPAMAVFLVLGLIGLAAVLTAGGSRRL